MRKLFKICLILNIIILIIILVILLNGMFNSYHNGINKNWFLNDGLLSGEKVLTYGMEAIYIYLEQFLFIFIICSILGIIPILNLPIMILLTKKMKLYKKINSFKTLLIPLIVCISLHILVFLIGPLFIAIILPYIECILISHLILYSRLKKN